MVGANIPMWVGVATRGPLWTTVVDGKMRVGPVMRGPMWTTREMGRVFITMQMGLRGEI